MLPNETMMLLKRMTQMWNNFPMPSAEDFELWQAMLEDTDKALAFKAVMYLFKNDPSPHAPMLKTLCYTIEQMKPEALEGAATAWACLTSRRQHEATPLALEAWRMWGGDSRWGSMPDPMYCENPREAETTLSFARKEFIEIYERMKTNTDKHPELLNGADIGYLGWMLKSIPGEKTEHELEQEKQRQKRLAVELLAKERRV